MSQGILFIKLLLLHYATQSSDVTHANCNDDVPLMCPGVDLDSMNFYSVTWYKLSNLKRQGIIRRDKGAEVPHYYNFSREVEFGEKYSLFLQSVKPEDAGAYECYISANVGSQNLNLQVNLTVGECVTLAEPTTVTNATTPSNSLCNKQAQDLPVIWSIGGYVAVGVTKIILSLISILVIRAIHIRSERRRQQQQWRR
uniref:Si:dkey-109a10.2 n=1 Tax=Sparus aurata TaxID=8175 RepID=A0A671UAG2_SPAAU